jgi:hypothetical protein
MIQQIEFVVPTWVLATILWFAVAGALLAFAQLVGAMDTQEEYEDTEYPNEEDE